MSIASLGIKNKSTSNPGFNGNFSNNAYDGTGTANMTVNFNRAFYQVTDNLVDAYYNFNVTVTALPIIGPTITVKLPVSPQNPLPSFNEFYWSAQMLQNNANSVSHGLVSISATPDELLFNFVSQGGNPLVIGGVYNIMIHLVYRIVE